LNLARIRFAINIDMIGRMQESKLEVFGSRSASGLRRLVSEANSSGEAKVKFDFVLKADSDHWPFYERRIPILMFHTGLHGDYHRPSDDAHKINIAGLNTSTKIALETVLKLANADQLPGFRDAGRRESPQTAASLEQPVATQQSRYGIPFKVETGDTPKIILTGLTPGSPAAKSGLKTGDQLLEFQGRPIRDEHRLRLELLAAQGETTFLVSRAESEIPLLFKVTPLGEPVRIGITWRADEGEPDSVIITQVIFGSAAQTAGIKVRDRLYSVGGQSFKTEQELVKLLTGAPGPLEMQIERDGQIRALTLDLIPPPAPL
jgi:S1-C subfamily serine protease